MTTLYGNPVDDGLFMRAASCIEGLVQRLERVERECETLIKWAKGRCDTCSFKGDCEKHEPGDGMFIHWYDDCEDWQWEGAPEGEDEPEIPATDVRSLFGDPKCLGYTGTPCPKCGRYRLEAYEGGGQRCQKCEWCPQLDRYIPDDEFFPQEEDWHVDQ